MDIRNGRVYTSDQEWEQLGLGEFADPYDGVSVGGMETRLVELAEANMLELEQLRFAMAEHMDAGARRVYTFAHEIRVREQRAAYLSDVALRLYVEKGIANIRGEI